ncbi:hypothetical protein J6590_038784 [Homalodisca vitripennis]|nr:hypothetical protein J6590_038784 [Homalodisca vitripennis]
MRLLLRPQRLPGNDLFNFSFRDLCWARLGRHGTQACAAASRYNSGHDRISLSNTDNIDHDKATQLSTC